ncbi:MAG: hypothetical protein CM15mP74_33110 [Halieaceae bacterium]|nr:MAG: hypothetical protein CM15mP74_33110 [Halieaceae bacterium]
MFDEEAAKIENVKWLAQGTIYPDVIESAGAKTGKAHVIKSHHKWAAYPRNGAGAGGALRELFKDEVRRIGLELGLPRDMVFRHPFPGPGLGVRILGEVKKNTPICSDERMPFLSKSFVMPGGMTRPVRPLPCSCR